MNATAITTFLVTVSLTCSCYLTRQGWGQARMLMAREPVEKVIADARTSEATRAKLLFVKQVLEFATREGLNATGAYQSLVQLDRPVVTYTLHAAMPYELRLKTWWFPIVGNAPYLGYFDKEDRDSEAKSLENEDFDVFKGGAAAYSSLGWFDDPLLSPMLERGDAELADLLFHELTHRTIWISGSAEFNENLAEFIAEKINEKFFGESARSADWEKYISAREDIRAFQRWAQNLRGILSDIYEKSKSLPDGEREKLKADALSLAISEKPAFSHYDFVGSGAWNNARLLAVGLYQPDQSRFERAFRCLSKTKPDLKAGEFLKALEKQAEKTSDGFNALDQLCPAG